MQELYVLQTTLTINSPVSQLVVKLDEFKNRGEEELNGSEY